MPSSRYSTTTNERNLKIRIPRPVDCRAGNHVYQDSLSDGRLGTQMEGFKQQNFYTNLI